MNNKLSCLYKKIKRKLPRKWNVIIDQRARALEDSEIDGLCPMKVLDLPEDSYWKWVNATTLPFRNESYPHKKALEFFFSYNLLDPKPDDNFMDAAGGRSGYLDAIHTHSHCQHLYLTDHIFEGVTKTEDGKYIVGGDIAGINLPDSSLTKISCHHAFEHFQEEKDTGFILEISRLLTPGGKACIIPAFLADQFIECWNIDHKTKYDEASQLVIDPSASIPGADEDGHFSRFYDKAAYTRRVLTPAIENGLTPTIYTCRFDGKDLPDMKSNFGSKLNYPLHALLLEKPLSKT